MSTRTFLRVKRRRTAQPASTIRLELLGGWNVQRTTTKETTRDDMDTVVATSASGGNTSSASSEDTQPHANGTNSSSTATPPTEQLLHQRNGVPRQHSSMRSMSTTTNSSSAAATQASSPTSNSSVLHKRKAAAVWKRVEQPDSSSSSQFLDLGDDCRVVDAILEDDQRSTKRRKLTVLGESTTTSTDYHHNNNALNHSKPSARRKGPNQYNNNRNATNRRSPPIHYRVLDPVSRLVQDSLQMVHTGERSIATHYTFVTTDPRLASDARRWLAYQSSSSQGNLLHACAHWNDVEVAHDLLRQEIPGVADAVDGEGRTPYEIAQLCHHDGVAEVMEAFGADTTNFVYDLFVQDYEHEREQDVLVDEHKQTEDQNHPLYHRNNGGVEGPAIMSTSSTSTSHAQILQPHSSFGDQTVVNGAPMIDHNGLIQHELDDAAAAAAAMVDASRLLEIQGGVGYWTEDGELILEVDPTDMMVGMNAEMSADDAYYGDDDIDSNCEDYGGNDYPDENECWEDDFYREDEENADNGNVDTGDIAGYRTNFLE